jgi:predicted nucleic acid-binding protein
MSAFSLPPRRVLFDTNVVLDVMLARVPHAPDSSQALSQVEQKRVTGLLGATTVTTLSYLMEKKLGVARSLSHLSILLDVFEVAPVDGRVLRDALSLKFSDYEDAVLHAAAVAAGCDGIVTRDGAGFAKSSLTVFTPAELLVALQTQG